MSPFVRDELARDARVLFVTRAAPKRIINERPVNCPPPIIVGKRRAFPLGAELTRVQARYPSECDQALEILRIASVNRDTH